MYVLVTCNFFINDMLGIFYAFCIMVFVQYYKCFVIIENKITSIVTASCFMNVCLLILRKCFFRISLFIFANAKIDFKNNYE